MKDLGDLRNEFVKSTLSEEQLLNDPIEMFRVWFEEYMATSPQEPTAMTVSTVDQNMRPWQRILLLKGMDEQGFVFFTNMNSNKGQHIAANPWVSLHFFWLNLERQISIIGQATPVTREESEAYFRSRPKESQLGAVASDQSQPLDSRNMMEDRFRSLTEKYAETDIPMPDHWGGYRVKPERMEFWQGGAHRMHDRFGYELINGVWQHQRLYP